MPVFDITLPPLRKPTKPNKVINVIGRKFTRLTPLGLLGIEGEKRESRAIWLCRCDCGNLLAIASHNLLQNICKSCGCLKRELDRTRCLTHGMSHTPVFYIWQGVISRCERPKTSRLQVTADEGSRYATDGMTLKPSTMTLALDLRRYTPLTESTTMVITPVATVNNVLRTDGR